MNFWQCVIHVFEQDDLMDNYRRLTGHKMGKDTRTQIERMVDKATGNEPPMFDDDEVQAFIRFVWDCVWTRLPDECFTDKEPDRG